MENSKAKVLQIIALAVLVIGFIGGIIAGFAIGGLTNSIESISSSFSVGGVEPVRSGFNFFIVIVVWITSFIQSALIWGFAELIDKSAKTTDYLEMLASQNRSQYNAPPAYPQQYPNISYPSNPNQMQNYPQNYNH